MDAFRLDLQYAFRALARRPGFAILAILTLAIGIGVNTVAFSAVNALLLKQFDVAHRDRTGWIIAAAPGNPYGMVSLDDFRDLARSASSFESLVAEGRLPVSVQIDGRADQGWSMLISTGYMELLGERPALGRLFTAADLQGADLPALVSQRFWTGTLGGGDSVAGRTVTVNGRNFSIVGVIRDGFQGPGGLYEPDLWLPLDKVGVLNAPPGLQGREDGWLTVVGRARPGLNRAAVEADIKAVFTALAAAHPATNKARTAGWHVMADSHPQLRGIATMAWVALGVVSLVLVIACFNVASLLLARASEREAEMGIRAALGAGRGRIVRQLVTEGTVLAALSGLASLVVAAWSANLLAAFSLPSPIPQRLHIGIDARLVAFTSVLVLVAGVVPALLPALHATRADLFRSMKLASAGTGKPSRARNIFVVAQIAGSTLFLASAFLFVRSFTNLANFNPGFDAAHVLVMELDPQTYGYDAARSRTFFTQLAERVALVPGVRQVALADRVPFYVGFTRTAPVSTDGTDCAAVTCRETTVYAAGPGHFNALGIGLRRGRDFSEADAQHGAAVIVSERTAAQFWPGADAVGQSFRLGKEGQQVQVIGVVADIKHRSMDEPERAILYRPIGKEDFGRSVSVVVRTAGDPGPLLATIQDQVQAIDPMLPARSGQTMTKRMEMPLWPNRTLAGFFAICGSLALVLATIGLFGVTYFAVNQRTREFGIRIALGATRGRVLSLVLREGLRLSLPGVVLGIAAALVAARLLGRALFGISPADPLTFGLTAAVQGTVALLACAVPAWRATRTDPIVALRQD